MKRLIIFGVIVLAAGVLFGINIIYFSDFQKRTSWRAQKTSVDAAGISVSDADKPAEKKGVTATASGEGELPGDKISDDETDSDGPEDIYNGDTFRDNGQPYCIKVNRSQNVVTVYTQDEEGYYTVPFKAMVCSVGLNDNTPLGTFKVQSDRYEWRELVGQVYGQYAVRIYKSIMFHSVPYYSASKDELESEEYNKLGEPASKGCIRLSVADAKWIYDNCSQGTIVQIFDSDYEGPLGKPVAQKLDVSSLKADYDPTDIYGHSPWYHEEPYIFGAEAVDVAYHSSFYPKSGISAYDCEGNDLTERINVSGSVDVDAPGTYTVVYTVIDDQERKTEISRQIRVLDKEGNFSEEPPTKEDEIIPEPVEKNPPVITLKEGIADTLTVAQAEDEEYMKSLVDITDESEIDSLTVSLPLWVSRKMSYRVVYIARDIYGNTTTEYFKFSIE